MSSAVFLLLYQDLGETLEQGTEPATTAPRVPQHCVHVLGWVKCRAQIPSMGHHTWPRVLSFPYVAMLRGGGGGGEIMYK